MKEYFIDVVKNHYLDYAGRATRKQYWMYTLWNFIIMFGLGVVSGIFGMFSDTLGNIMSLLMLIVSLGLLLPNVCILIRRVRDLGITGWATLVGIVPFIGALVLLVFCVMPTDALAKK